MSEVQSLQDIHEPAELARQEMAEMIERSRKAQEQIANYTQEQVDELISAQLPHTATLINDITISDEKLREVA